MSRNPASAAATGRLHPVPSRGMEAEGLWLQRYRQNRAAMAIQEARMSQASEPERRVPCSRTGGVFSSAIRALDPTLPKGQHVSMQSRKTARGVSLVAVYGGLVVTGSLSCLAPDPRDDAGADRYDATSDAQPEEPGDALPEGSGAMDSTSGDGAGGDNEGGTSEDDGAECVPISERCTLGGTPCCRSLKCGNGFCYQTVK